MLDIYEYNETLNKLIRGERDIMKNVYEQDRIELLKNTEWYGYFADPVVFEQTMEANDILIKREGAKLRCQNGIGRNN